MDESTGDNFIHRTQLREQVLGISNEYLDLIENISLSDEVTFCLNVIVNTKINVWTEIVGNQILEPLLIWSAYWGKLNGFSSNRPYSFFNSPVF